MHYTNNKDTYVYNPNVDYYFLSVRYVGKSPRWYRSTFLTKDEINEFLIEYFQDRNNYENLEIFNEQILRNIISVKNKEGELVQTDLRTWLFDSRYSSRVDYYEKIISGEIAFTWKEGFKEWAEKSGYVETV